MVKKGLLLTLCHCQRVPARSIFSLNRHRFLLYMKSVKPMGGSRYMNTLENIQNSMDLLSKSERKVAEVILASPQTAIHSSIATLAKMANVSEPTVNRFAVVWRPKVSLILNCIWRKVWRTVHPM